ncbi:hypothetical protein ACFE04_007615 [Oxalis oulophora]
MPPECTLPPPSEDGKDSEDIVENWNFKIYIGGRVLYQPTVHYLGGKSWDYAITPKEMNIDKLDLDSGEPISISREDPILSSSLPRGEGAPIDGDGVTIDGDANQFDEYEETEDSGIDDEEDHNSVDGVSFCSDRVDEELVSLMKDAENIIDTAATHGPETDAIRHNRRELNRNNSDDEYDVGTNYMEDPNLNWSFTTDEDFVPEDSDGEEVNDTEVGIDNMRIPHTGERGEGKEAELAAAQAAYVAELAAEKVAYAAARKRNVGPSVETNGRDTNTTFMPTPRLVKKRKGKDLMANAPKKPWK